MRMARIIWDGQPGVAIPAALGARILLGASADLDVAVTGHDEALRGLYAKVEREGKDVPESGLRFLPLLGASRKIICLGLNFRDHASEAGAAGSGGDRSSFPTLFPRFCSSLIGHEAPLIRPRISNALDFEGEMAAIIGLGGKNIPVETALSHVVGYSVFNDASVRDYQKKTSQLTPGKNFDGTGAFGPWLVTVDELPPGAAGLMLVTRLNGAMVQRASTADMIFDVASTVSLLSSFLTLQAGDVLVMGTPSGVGSLRTPPLFMKPGDVVEVEIEGIGILRNPVVAE